MAQHLKRPLTPAEIDTLMRTVRAMVERACDPTQDGIGEVSTPDSPVAILVIARHQAAYYAAKLRLIDAVLCGQLDGALLPGTQLFNTSIREDRPDPNDRRN